MTTKNNPTNGELAGYSSEVSTADSLFMPDTAPDVNSFIDRMEANAAAFEAQCDPLQGDDIQAEPPKQYAFKSASDILNEPRTQYIVRGLLPDCGLCAVYGAPGAGKSFFIIHLAACIAEGEPFFERNTTQRKVYLFCLEGSGGLRGRLEAWQSENARSYPAQVSFYTDALGLIDEATECAPQLEQGSVVIIDTLNAAAPTMDENSSRDMGQAIEAAKIIQRTAQATVILVHHCGKDYQKGLRGHSSLNAALDCAIELTRNSNDVRTWRIQKSKDGVDGTARDFMLKSVLLHITDGGHEITSCVIDESIETTVKEKKLSRGNAYALRTLEACIAKECTDAVDITIWDTAYHEGHWLEKKESRERLFRSVRAELVALGKIYAKHNQYALKPFRTETEKSGNYPKLSEGQIDTGADGNGQHPLGCVRLSAVDGGYEYE